MHFTGISFTKYKYSILFTRRDCCVMLTFSPDIPFMYYRISELETIAYDALNVTCQHEFNALKSRWLYLSEMWLGASESSLSIHYI